VLPSALGMRITFGLIDFSSLTPEQIAQLQANMLDEIQDADARPLISQIQPMEVLMVCVPLRLLGIYLCSNVPARVLVQP
jgi:hypothetical protein